MKIIFCNITWMKYYQGALAESQLSAHGGRHVIETGFGAEEYNFKVFPEGKCMGFVITAGSNKHKLNKMNIDKLSPDCKDALYVDEVLVVWTAYNEKLGKTVIVGWYKDARVYRNYRFQDIDRERYAATTNQNGRPYNIVADAANVTLLEPTERRFQVPRARGNTFGLGQSNVWYANQNEQAREYVASVVHYIDKYSG